MALRKWGQTSVSGCDGIDASSALVPQAPLDPSNLNNGKGLKGVWSYRQEKDAQVWPLVKSGLTSRGEERCEPLAVDFSFFQSPGVGYSVDDVWDGEALNEEMVSKWVASKLKSIAGCIGVAFSGYELETIQLLSRIEKSIATAKPSVKRSPPSSRGVRELRRLQFGVNYERPSSSSSGLKVFNG